MNDTNQMIGILKTLMVSDNYPIASPVVPDTMADLMRKPAPTEWDKTKRGVFADIQRLVLKRQDYVNMLKIMDGLEYNGLTLYGMTQTENGEPAWSNIYIRNIYTRDNDIYVDPNLTNKLVIGEDGMSVFVYSPKDDCFQIRDKASTDYVIETHATFGDLLASVIDTVK
ncbi:YrhA family protein [Pantoea sp. 1.19]|uniref:YrhA family protein n=1 Tax=Pantoea sp. 1.19 TaxID=1925589 RepID=UPI000948A401|nr:YrhA family protein [Pantoea sp. 1.19]